MEICVSFSRLAQVDSFPLLQRPPLAGMQSELSPSLTQRAGLLLVHYGADAARPLLQTGLVSVRVDVHIDALQLLGQLGEEAPIWLQLAHFGLVAPGS